MNITKFKKKNPISIFVEGTWIHMQSLATLGARHLNQDNREHKFQHRSFKFVFLHWQLCSSALEYTCIILENSTPLLLKIKDIAELEDIQLYYFATNLILNVHESKCTRCIYSHIYFCRSTLWDHGFFLEYCVKW